MEEQEIIGKIESLPNNFSENDSIIYHKKTLKIWFYFQKKIKQF